MRIRGRWEKRSGINGHNSYQINEPVEIGGVGLCFRPFASTTLRRIV